MVDQPRTDSGADDLIGERRWELGARTRQYDRVCRDMRALTEEVIRALSTAEHRMTLRGGLPFCACGLSLEGGDASGAFITHILAIWREAQPFSRLPRRRGLTPQPGGLTSPLRRDDQGRIP